MRSLVAIGSVIAISFALVSCSDDDRPNDVPRTIPPVTDGGTASAPAVKGVGPTIEVLAFQIGEG